MKKRFNVRVLGQELSVVSDSGDEHVGNVVRYVNERASEAARAAGSSNALTVAILTALNIADEYLRIDETHRNLCKELENRAKQLIQLIDDIR